MASSGKKKTTFSKLARESRLRERRQDKQLRKEARRAAAAVQGPETFAAGSDHLSAPGDGEPPVSEDA